MDRLVNLVDSSSSSELDGSAGTMSEKGLGSKLSFKSFYEKPAEGNLASSSSIPLKSYFVGMGFSPNLVEKVIEENGEQDANFLLETLFTHSALQNTTSESPDSLNGLATPKAENSSSFEFSSASNQEIEEVDVSSQPNTDKRQSLLMMNFSAEEVDLAMSRLGEGAHVTELVDFIIAAQTSGDSGEEEDNSSLGGDAKPKIISTDTLFGAVDKTLCLLEMGFSKDDISSAIEKFGSEVPTPELADAILATKVPEDEDPPKLKSNHHSWNQKSSRCLGSAMEEHMKRHYSVSQERETAASISNAFPNVNDVDFRKMGKGKKAIYLPLDHESTSFGTPRAEARMVDKDFKELGKWKKGKYAPLDDMFPFFATPKPEDEVVEQQTSSYPMSNPYREIYDSAEVGMNMKFPRNLHQSKPPYFFYGNVVDISQETWTKISEFLFAIQPEYVNCRFFSPFIRKEGYVHNLPTENRFHILPRPPVTIEEALPHTKRWWPSWDTRKQLSCIKAETMEALQICEQLGRILVESQGMLSKELQTDILHQCKTLNLIWVGQYKLSPIAPHQLELILGYPVHHTQVGDWHPEDRLTSLRSSFQTDTLGYHLSPLKGIFPDGMTVLSLFSGIGGAEVALHRLGVTLKCVVSVETSRRNREILKKWWQDTRQPGELRLMDNIRRLTSDKIENLVRELGGFDLVVGGNPCTSANAGNPAALDLNQFYDFVRVLQRVRSIMGRN